MPCASLENRFTALDIARCTSYRELAAAVNAAALQPLSFAPLVRPRLETRRLFITGFSVSERTESSSNERTARESIGTERLETGEMLLYLRI